MDVGKRIRALETGSPSGIEVRLVLPGTMALEAELHKRFESDRVSPAREWFHPSSALLSFIATGGTDSA